MIHPVLLSEDIQASVRLARALGASVMIGDGSLRIQPGARKTETTVDCGESGTTLRLGIAIAAARGMPSRFEGCGRLVGRPIGTYLELFKAQGMPYDYEQGLPLEFSGRWTPGHYRIDGSVSSQYLSGLLLALPLLEGDSLIEVTGTLTSGGYVKMTLAVLAHFGIRFQQHSERLYRIPGRQTYRARPVGIEGDFSQAAFWAVGASLSGSVHLEGLPMETCQGDRAIVTCLEQMGGDLLWEADCLRISRAALSGAVIDVSQIPDLVPVLALAASAGMGRTVLEHTGRLKYKESDRARAIATELSKLGAQIRLEEDRMVIEGVGTLTGGRVSSWGDHRIAMTLAIASVIAQEEIVIDGFEAVNKSYPHFLEDYQQLGGKVHES